MKQRFLTQQRPILSVVNDHLIDYLTPSNLSYWWRVGFLAGICLLLPLIVGFTLGEWFNCTNAWFLEFEDSSNPVTALVIGGSGIPEGGETKGVVARFLQKGFGCFTGGRPERILHREGGGEYAS